MNSKSEKTMGVSPITRTIYYGVLKNDEWIGEKEDVTDMAIRAVSKNMEKKSIVKAENTNLNSEMCRMCYL